MTSVHDEKQALNQELEGSMLINSRKTNEVFSYSMILNTRKTNYVFSEQRRT